MANRNTLAVTKLDDFKAWLVSDGWQIQEPKGDYEVLRATKEGKKYPLIVYKRFDTNGGKDLVHYSLLDRDVGVVRAYLKKEIHGGRDMKTVTDITKRMHDIKALGYGVENNIIEKIDINIIAHFGNIPCLTIVCENIVPYGLYNDISRVGFLLKAIVEFFGIDREDGVWLSSLKNIPCRLVFEGDGDNHFGEKAVGIGHYMKDKFILFEDFGKLAEESEDTE